MSRRTLYCYCVFPVDYWIGWIPLRDAYTQIFQHVGDAKESAAEIAKLNQMLTTLREVSKTKFHWEGDIAQGPFVCAIPGEDFEFALAFKQSNNGTTFICCFFDMPHLFQHSAYPDVAVPFPEKFP